MSAEMQDIPNKTVSNTAMTICVMNNRSSVIIQRSIYTRLTESDIPLPDCKGLKLLLPWAKFMLGGGPPKLFVGAC